MKIYCYSNGSYYCTCHVNKEFWESTLTFLNELNDQSKNKFEVYSTSKLGLKKLIRDEELK